MRLKIDFDAILSNLLLYLLLAGYIATIYTAVLSTMMSLGQISTQDPRVIFAPPWWINLIVIILVALTFLPVRRWLSTRTNALIYGEHDDPYGLISRINKELDGMVSPQLTLPRVAQTIAAELKLPYIAIRTQGFAPPLQVELGIPPPPSDLNLFRLLYLDRAIGELCVGARRPREGLSGADADLLRDLAHQIGIALHAVQLTADLQSSRERLVIAREEERRRIRNDLHDGLAPTLSSLQIQLGSLKNLIHENPPQAEMMVDEMRVDLREATTRIRELVYNLRPPMLDELGLIGAIKSFRFRDSPIQFDYNAPEHLPKLPAAVEVAVYRIASEAIHNVVKHSQATRCLVSIELNDGRLILSVSDDGISLPHEHTIGVGLHSMQERVAELGGTLSIQSCEDRGTCLTAQFPVTD